MAKQASRPTITEQRWSDLGFSRLALRLPSRTLVVLDAIAKKRGEPRWKVLEQLIWQQAMAER